MYTKELSGAIRRHADNASIPPDPRNSDYRKYLAWVAEGNEPEVELQEDPTVVEDREATVSLNSRMNKVLSGVFFDIDSRLRVIEGKNQITLAAFRRALKSRYLDESG